MASFEEVASTLADTGKEIERVVANYKRDSKERRSNKAYFEQRIKRLQNLWLDFEHLDTQARTLKDVNMDSEYFTQNYYSKVQQLAESYLQIFEEGLENVKRLEATKSSEFSRQQTAGSAAAKQNEGTLPQSQDDNVKQEGNMIRRLINKQKAIIISLQRLLRGMEDNSERQSLSFLELSISRLNKLWNDAEKVNFEIWELSSEPIKCGYDLDGYLQLEEEVQSRIIGLTEQAAQYNAREQAAQHNASYTADSIAARADISNCAVKLPKVTIPTFDGTYLKWAQFADLFTQLVHNQAMPGVQKMWYLKTTLSGEAERLVRHLALSENNYDTAWRLLQERYNNKRVLASTLLQKMLSVSSTGTASSLKNFHDTVQECLLALNNIDIKTDSWDPLLLHLLTKKVDPNTHMLYEQSLDHPKELQSLADFLGFVETHFQSLEAIGQRSSSHTNTRTCNSAILDKGSKACTYCNINTHPLYKCEKFLKAPVVERLKFTRMQQLCHNCLQNGHFAVNCKSRNCPKCGLRHNSLLHKDTMQHTAKSSAASNQSRQSSEKTASNSNATGGNTSDAGSASSQRVMESSTCKSNRPANSTNEVVSLTASKQNSRQRYVLLSTAMVKLTASNGRELICKALLDSGSQVNLVTERVMQSLQLKASSTSMRIDGIGSSRRTARQRVNVTLNSRCTNYAASLEAFVLPHIISQQPMQYIDVTSWGIPSNIMMADPSFNHPQKIDVLLGAEFYPHIISSGKLQLGDDLPILRNTSLGWIVAGAITEGSDTNALCCALGEDDETLDTLLARFWELDETNEVTKPLSKQESLCETHFTQNVQRTNDGRYVVKLPLLQKAEALGDSLQIARNRFLALERRLLKDPTLKEQYSTFMMEYEALGHMQKIEFEDIVSPHYIIPHHCVLKPDSSTTKLRVVFDASCKSSTGTSLNDLMYTGPVVQSELFTTLLRFRMPRFAFTTDIEKMYRQVLVHPEDRMLQLIIWRQHQREPLQYYQLNTVTYGTRAAPYLATKCLQSLANEHSTSHPLGAEALRNSTYVDDIVHGADSLNEIQKVQQELTAILSSAGFKLRKWCANHPQLLQAVPLQDQEVSWELSTDAYKSAKTLGVNWTPQSDSFCIKTQFSIPSSITKRTIASNIARIYDPLGIVAPVVARAKIFMQKVWGLQVTWDQPLPEAYSREWIRFCDELQTMNDKTVPRHVFNHKRPDSVQLHCFTDASEHAYGAVIYARAKLRDGSIIVHMLCSKSRVAPLKRQTIPRLELCAALLGTQLLTRVKYDLKYDSQKTFLWTDSQVVLYWINSTSSSFQTFVSHRVAKIQELSTAEQWRHVASKSNPADFLSRGMSPKELYTNHMWFYGPMFLYSHELTWPTPIQIAHLIPDYSETKRAVLELQCCTAATSASIAEVISNIRHGGSFSKLLRIVGYMKRFIKSLKSDHHRNQSAVLTADELEDSLQIIVKAIQQSEFESELAQLQKASVVHKTSSLASLSPFIDDNGILRVGGRLNSSSLSFDAKHPMLITYNDPIVKLLFRETHVKNMHCGPQALLSQVRLRFWPIKGKIMARSTVQHCVRCTRSKPITFEQVMGNLPSTRVQASRPFLNAGVDFCGPLWVHYKIRGKRPHKVYLAVYCCFATKAVHLEVVSDLTTDAFIGSLKRFIARRGHCTNLYCDNATNFVGANNKLNDLVAIIHTTAAQDEIERACSNKGITFHFIPPRAPHFGGLWEAAVKSAKYLLMRTVSTASLTYEELETVVVEVEAILNSRPITPLSSDPNDLAALTPGHFLIGEALTAPVDRRRPDEKMGLLTRWTLVSHLKQEFWRRWTTEYLNELQQRRKWKDKSTIIEEGTMVLLKEDNVPPLQWPLGRIVKLYKGEDGLVRVVEVKTSTGILKRPIHRLAPLFKETGLESEVRRENESHAQLEEAPEPTAKRIRRINTGVSYMTATILALCMLPLILALPASVTQFTHSEKLHFEGLGTVKRVSSHWNLIVYYDLTPVIKEMTALDKGTQALKLLCEQIVQKETCISLTNYFEHAKTDLNIDNKLIASTRAKRGALNIVGNIANSLFGVLDSEYADQMSTTINSVQGNEEHLRNLLKNQTSILDATLNIVKHNQASARIRFQEFEHQINEVTAQVRNTIADMNQISVVQTFMSIAVQLTIITTSLQQTFGLFLDVITDSRHGKINPLLISPDQLQKEISQIRNHLPTGTQLPMHQEDLLGLYKVMTSIGGITRDHVVFHIKIPLINGQQFHLFNVIPIPVVINNMLVSTRSDCSLLAINPHRDVYFPLSSDVLQTCITQSEDILLCPYVQTIYNKGAEICACEVNALNNETQWNCEIENTTSSSKWTQLRYGNQWIFGLTIPTRMTVVCDSNISQMVLSGSGLLKLLAGCSMKYKSMTLQAHQSITSVTQQGYTVSGLMQDIVNPQHQKNVLKLLNITSQDSKSIELITDLQTRLANQGLEMPTLDQQHTYHHFTVEYIALSLALIIMAYTAWTKLRKSPATEMHSAVELEPVNEQDTYAVPQPAQPPQPAQRQQISRFILNV